MAIAPILAIRPVLGPQRATAPGAAQVIAARAEQLRFHAELLPPEVE